MKGATGMMCPFCHREEVVEGVECVACGVVVPVGVAVFVGDEEEVEMSLEEYLQRMGKDEKR